jgi:hypothetical protein
LSYTLLEELGCENLRLETLRRYVPNSNIVTYTLNDTVRSTFSEFDRVTAREMGKPGS